jgi:hypothetical protein
VTTTAVRTGGPPAAAPAAWQADPVRRAGDPVPVRRAVGSAIMLVAALAVVLFAVPLAIAAAALYRDEALGRLSAEASRAAGIVSGDALRPGADADRPVALPRPRRPETELAV